MDGGRDPFPGVIAPGRLGYGVDRWRERSLGSFCSCSRPERVRGVPIQCDRYLHTLGKRLAVRIVDEGAEMPVGVGS